MKNIKRTLASSLLSLGLLATCVSVPSAAVATPLRQDSKSDKDDKPSKSEKVIKAVGNGAGSILKDLGKNLLVTDDITRTDFTQIVTKNSVKKVEEGYWDKMGVPAEVGKVGKAMLAADTDTIQKWYADKAWQKVDPYGFHNLAEAPKKIVVETGACLAEIAGSELKINNLGKNTAAKLAEYRDLAYQMSNYTINSDQATYIAAISLCAGSAAWSTLKDPFDGILKFFELPPVTVKKKGVSPAEAAASFGCKDSLGNGHIYVNCKTPPPLTCGWTVDFVPKVGQLWDIKYQLCTYASANVSYSMKDFNVRVYRDDVDNIIAEAPVTTGNAFSTQMFYKVQDSDIGKKFGVALMVNSNNVPGKKKGDVYVKYGVFPVYGTVSGTISLDTGQGAKEITADISHLKFVPAKNVDIKYQWYADGKTIINAAGTGKLNDFHGKIVSPKISTMKTKGTVKNKQVQAGSEVYVIVTGTDDHYWNQKFESPHIQVGKSTKSNTKASAKNPLANEKATKAEIVTYLKSFGCKESSGDITCGGWDVLFKSDKSEWYLDLYGAASGDKRWADDDDIVSVLTNLTGGVVANKALASFGNQDKKYDKYIVGPKVQISDWDGQKVPSYFEKMLPETGIQYFLGLPYDCDDLGWDNPICSSDTKTTTSTPVNAPKKKATPTATPTVKPSSSSKCPKSAAPVWGHQRMQFTGTFDGVFCSWLQ